MTQGSDKTQGPDNADRDDLSKAYDFSGEVRVTYAERYAEGASIDTVGILKLVSQSERSIKLDHVKPHSEVMSELRTRLNTN